MHGDIDNEQLYALKNTSFPHSRMILLMEGFIREKL